MIFYAEAADLFRCDGVSSMRTKMGLLAPLVETMPLQINLGSGKDYRSDFLNIDISDDWYPDVVVDLSSTVIEDPGFVVSSARFGDICLAPGTFKKIIANDVLEHVKDLRELMTNCLQLLEIGGIFEILVPYDLSFGAWQDPTHVRAFNEKSWLYYTDWFWWLGWNSVRFVTDALHFVPSEFGKQLVQKSVPNEDIIRTPRAIDSMIAHLKKVPLSDIDMATLAHFRANKNPARRQDSQIFARVDTKSPSDNIKKERPFRGSFEEHRNRYCVFQVIPQGYVHSHAFDEIVISLSDAFAGLGGSAPAVTHPSQFDGRIPIVVGAHLLAMSDVQQLPPETIILNTEQIHAEGCFMSQHYLAVLNCFSVLDYSARNIAQLAQYGIRHTLHLPLGFTPSLRKIAPHPVKDVDVLFYGSLSERRTKVLNALHAAGVKVQHLFGVYGTERDAAIARSKLVLNLQTNESKIFEAVRVYYLLTNGICVLSEGDPADPDTAPFAAGITLSPYDQFVDRCVSLLADPARRADQARAGYELISRRPQSTLLASLFQN
jgi:SAM-dependent methyltransferase